MCVNPDSGTIGLFANESSNCKLHVGSANPAVMPFERRLKMSRLGSVFRALALAAMCATPIAAADDPVLSPPAKPYVFDPPNADGPVVVTAWFRLLNIGAIDDNNETIEFSGILGLTWKDPRQAFDPAQEGTNEKVYTGAFQFNEISPSWYPQVTLANAAGQYESRAVTLKVKPDGTSTLLEAVDATAKVQLNMRRYPFDRQRLEAIFGVLGVDSSQVVLETTPTSASIASIAKSVPQWHLNGIGALIRSSQGTWGEDRHSFSNFVVTLDVTRMSFFIVRLVVVPLIVIVLLSFSVFWMDRSSVGDRISVSFIGILTAVAFQITMSELLPRIAYVTLINGFMNFCFFTMCATVVINLVVGSHEKNGRHEAAIRLDRRCRRVFPIVFFGLNLAAVAIAFLVF